MIVRPFNFAIAILMTFFFFAMLSIHAEIAMMFDAVAAAANYYFAFAE